MNGSQNEKEVKREISICEFKLWDLNKYIEELELKISEMDELPHDEIEQLKDNYSEIEFELAKAYNEQNGLECRLAQLKSIY